MKKIIILLSLFSTMLLAADAKQNAEIFGIWTLIPPLVAIALAFITKDVILSLFLGAFSGTIMLSLSENFLLIPVQAFVSFVSRVINSMADSWNAGIMLQVLAIGGVVALITKMGGTKAVAQWLSTKAKSGVSAQISTWFMGLFVFFDDYANALIVGPIMRPITDKYKISREKLAFIIDATAAPISGIAVVSTWVGYELSLIKDSYALIDITNINAFGIFVETIPYRFYNIFMLFFVVCTALMQREFGSMYKAQMRALKHDLVSSNKTTNLMSVEDKALEPKEGVKLQASNAIIPLFVLIATAFLGFYFNGYAALDGEILKQVSENPYSFLAFRETFGAADASVVLFQAALFASIIAIFMGVYKKIFSISESIDIWLKGWKTMIITIVVLLLAWSLSSVIKDLGTSKYLVEILSNSIPKFILPTAIFILGSFISFSTGTSYGTMGIIMPLAIPLAFAVGTNNALQADELMAYVIMNVGSVLTGAIFGDHCSPISDTTILSSMGSGCNHIDHVSTQMAYALAVGAITIVVGYLPVALGVSVSIVLPLGLFATFLVVRFLGRKVQ